MNGTAADSSIKAFMIRHPSYELMENQILDWIVEYGLPISGMEEEALVLGGDSGDDGDNSIVIGRGTYKVQVRMA